MLEPRPSQTALGLIAGSGAYPELVIQEARKAGVLHVALAAFEGETSFKLADQADSVRWLRVGQLNAMLHFFKEQNVTHTLMAGQIAPKRLFDLRPDWKALLLLAKLKKRNAETIFGAIGDLLNQHHMPLLPAIWCMEKHLAPLGWIAGPRLSKAPKWLAEAIEFGWPIAKKIAEMDIGQTIVVKKGTVMAVEGFDGTDSTLERGGRLAGEGGVAIKLTKPGQDFRFDVPVIGLCTIESAVSAKLSAIVCEAKKTLLLQQEELRELASKHGVVLWGHEGS